MVLFVFQVAFYVFLAPDHVIHVFLAIAQIHLFLFHAVEKERFLFVADICCVQIASRRSGLSLSILPMEILFWLPSDVLKGLYAIHVFMCVLVYQLFSLFVFIVVV